MRAFVVTGPRPGRGRRTSPAPVAGAGRGRRRRRAGRGLRHRRRVLHRRDGLPAHGPRRRTRCGSGTSGAARSSAVGAGVDTAWLGRRVTGDTMLGCGALPRCLDGRQHVCARPLRDRHPRRLARRAGRAAAGAGTRRCTRCPTGGRDAGRAGRAGRQRAARPCGRRRSARATGCWCSARARSACSSRCSRRGRGAEVHLAGPRRRSLEFARDARRSTASGPPTTLPALPFDAVDRRVQRRRRCRRCAARPGRAGQAGRLHRPRGQPEPDRHPRRSCSRTSPRSASSAPRPGSPARSSSTPPGGRPAPAGRRDRRPRRVGDVLAGGARRAGAGPKIHVDPRSDT